MVIKYNKNIYNEAIQKYLFSKGFEWVDTGKKIFNWADGLIKVDLQTKKITCTSYSDNAVVFPDDLAKIEKALKPKIEVGSYVRLKEDGDNYKNQSGKFKKGDIFQVVQTRPGNDWIRHQMDISSGVHKELLELVTKEDYDAYIESKKPKLTFGGKNVHVYKGGYGEIVVECSGVVGTLKEIQVIYDFATRKIKHEYFFGSAKLKKIYFEGGTAASGMSDTTKIVEGVKIGCTVGTLEELQAIIEAGNKLK